MCILTAPDVKALLIMLNWNKEAVFDMLKKIQLDSLLKNIELMTVDEGLFNGLFATGNIYNKIYQKTKLPAFLTASNRCFNKLLNDSVNDYPLQEFSFWPTSSQGLFCLHDGLLNGLSGVGLALLSAISGMELKWEEFIIC